MKRILWLVLALALAFPLAGCQPLEETEAVGFDTLARWVPADVDQAFFLDLKPDGEMARNWDRIRRQVESRPEGQELLSGLYAEFRIQEYGLEPFLVGPAVQGYRSFGYVVAQVNDEQGAVDAMLAHVGDTFLEQEEWQGSTLYQGRNSAPNRQNEWLAWTASDGLFFLAVTYNRYDPEGQAIERLREMVDLYRGDSLAVAPAWKTLRDRLPAAPLGLIFANIAQQAGSDLPLSANASPGDILNHYLEAVAFVALPEPEGMRVEFSGVFRLRTETPAMLQALFDLPPAEPDAWTALPADTALALFAHDASVVWPWLKDLFSLNTNALAPVRQGVGLDLEADLLGENGPLTGAFALGVTPPLPDQPVTEGLSAAQMLILARDATAAQVDNLRAAMESRGAVFGPAEAEGLALQTQVGTAASGYAISYGFDGGLLFLGSSPDVIGRGVAARREGDGLVETDAFQAVLDTLPDKPVLVAFLHSQLLLDLIRVNMAEAGQQAMGGEVLLLESFEAVGTGLRIQADRLDGVIYFLLK